MTLARLKNASLVYFALAGIACHLLIVYLYFGNYALFNRLKNMGLDKLEELIPAVAEFREELEPQYNLDQEIEINFAPWQPDQRYASQASGKIIYASNYRSLNGAAKALVDGDTLIIDGGIYQQAMVIRANNVSIIGSGHVVLENTAAGGKAAIVIAGNNTRIANLECRKIAVRDRNGACIRLQGENLFLEHVYFHSSQQGLLTGGDPGKIFINNSRFEKLGYGGRAHGIYVGGGELSISDSLFIAAKGQGHEVKSRANKTSIVRSTLSSLSSRDSRLIDITRGGELLLVENLLHKGPLSVNADLIGFGLEKSLLPNSSVVMERNTIIMERRGTNRLLHVREEFSNFTIKDNLLIGDAPESLGEDNLIFESRKAAGLEPYPALLHRTPGP